MWNHYVYFHIRNDTQEVFYVGKGKRGRAHESKNRSEHWKRIVEKHGYTVFVVASCMTDDDAKELEKDFIAEFGRADLGCGLLINRTDGGEGSVGIIVSQEARKLLSRHASLPRSKAWIDSIRKARKNGGNGGVVKRGDLLDTEWRKNLGLAKLGSKNPMYGKTGKNSHISKKVIDKKTGVLYDSVTIAAENNGYKMKTLYNWLSGFRPNPTSLEFK